MPEERKDTEPTAQEEGAKVSSDGLGAGGEISVAVDQLAAVTLADHDEAGTSESQHDSVDQLHDPLPDPELWKPHPPTEDWPVCFVPLPLDGSNRIYAPCCGKTICYACNEENKRALEITNRKREKKELPPLEESCAFCRETALDDDSEILERLEKRMDKGDVNAMFTVAFRFLDGAKGIAKDEAKGLELLKKAAHMGLAKAMANLGIFYVQGNYGVPADLEKGIVHLKCAVKMGDVHARCLLARLYSKLGIFHIALKHFRLAAEAGDVDAMKNIWHFFSAGNLRKKDLEEILRTHQANCDEMDSEDRRRWEAYRKALAGTDDILKGFYSGYYHGNLNAKQLKQVLKLHRNGSSLAQIQIFVRSKYGLRIALINDAST